MLTWRDLPIEWRADFCNEFEASLGDPQSNHVSPAGYTMQQLKELERFCVCPLHVHSEHPGVPIAEVNRDVAGATAEFDELSEARTGIKAGNDGHPGPYVIEDGEYEDVLSRHPRARDWLAHHAEEIRLTVVAGAA